MEASGVVVCATGEEETEAVSWSPAEKKDAETQASTIRGCKKTSSMLGNCPCKDLYSHAGPQHGFERCASAIFSYRCSALGFASEDAHFLHVNNTLNFDLEGGPTCVRIDWVRINRLHRHPLRKVGMHCKVVYYEEDSDGDLVDDRPYYDGPWLRTHRFGGIPKDYHQDVINKECRHVSGNIYLADPGADASSRDVIFQSLEGEVAANVVPGDMLVLQGPPCHIEDNCYYHKLYVDLHTRDRTGRKLQVAEGMLEISGEIENDIYHINHVNGTNGSVDVCYSVITSPLFLRFAARALQQPQCLHVFGSISAREFDHDGVEMHLFWADRDHPALVSDDGIIPLVRNSLTVREGIDIIISVNLYDCSLGSPSCIAKGQVSFAPSLKYTPPHPDQHQHIDLSIPGIELMVAVVIADSDTCCR